MITRKRHVRLGFFSTVNALAKQFSTLRIKDFDRLIIIPRYYFYVYVYIFNNQEKKTIFSQKNRVPNLKRFCVPKTRVDQSKCIHSTSSSGKKLFCLFTSWLSHIIHFFPCLIPNSFLDFVWCSTVPTSKSYFIKPIDPLSSLSELSFDVDNGCEIVCGLHFFRMLREKEETTPQFQRIVSFACCLLPHCKPPLREALNFFYLYIYFVNLHIGVFLQILTHTHCLLGTSMCLTTFCFFLLLLCLILDEFQWDCETFWFSHNLDVLNRRNFCGRWNICRVQHCIDSKKN